VFGCNLKPYLKEEESEEEAAPEEEQAGSSKWNKADFCVNPEELRARRAARARRPPPATRYLLLLHLSLISLCTHSLDTTRIIIISGRQY
jgi:hypothetical protein